MQDDNKNKDTMRVMILTCDIFSRIGGGEQVYRTLILENPTIDFYYLTTGKDSQYLLPKNATAIKLKRSPRLSNKISLGRYNKNVKSKSIIKFNSNERKAAEKAFQYASSIKCMEFDLVDVPEYEIVGDYLHAALERHNVTFKKVSTFLHGSLSRTLEFEDGFSKSVIQELRDLEEKQRNAADFFFSLSDWYLSLLGIEKSRSLIFNPWLFVSNHEITSKERTSTVPKLVHFSRSERRKGADLLPGLVKLASETKFDVLLLGEQAKESKYLNSIKSSAAKREVNLQCLEILEKGAAFECVNNNDILVIPSRFDSFNLVALEGLASGKNIVLSNQTGAFHFLKKHHDEIVFLEFNPLNLSESARFLNQGYKDFESKKSITNQNKLLCDEFRSNVVLNQMTLELPQYLMSCDKPKAHFSDVFVFSKNSYLRTVIQNNKLGKLLLRKIRVLKTAKNTGLRSLGSSGSGNLMVISLTYLSHVFPVSYLIGRTTLNHWFKRPQRYLELSESSSLDLQRRLTYALRVLRFSGYSKEVIDIKSIQSDLVSLGLIEEMKAIQAICADDNGDRVLEYLEKRRSKFKLPPEFTFTVQEQLESENLADSPTVTIIVSSYNASSKLRVFLEKLSLCRELSDGRAEILLIDANSNSPDHITAVRIANLLGISLRSLRVDRRISIQEAWNFGVINSHSSYLTFLGVDETIFPNAINDLSQELDRHSSADWVMADSIVTEVDSDGNYVKDIIKYDRSGAVLGSPFLETCYVSYVGGMYRRNIHERFGYYDPSFKGAGDTEFKSRVLPSLNVRYLKSTLGEFMNYPEERTTATERIEIEDLRAWYIFRTIGGVMYQANLAKADFLESISTCSLGYRKSFCSHESTDLELAAAAHRVIKKKNKTFLSESLTDLADSNKILNSLRITLGFGSKNSKSLGGVRVFKFLKWFDSPGRNSILNGARRMRFDNMFEQHNWFW